MSNVIDLAAEKGNSVKFIPLNGKEPLLNKGPVRAVNILRNRPNSWVFLVPDLYPPNKPFYHETFEELKMELEERFLTEIRRKNIDARILGRFRVHCFQYDFEVLLLASDRLLFQRIGAKPAPAKWIVPVENQNHGKPPKRVVESLFSEAGKKYKDTSDAPWILERSDVRDLMEKCTKRFKPFMDDLLEILEIL